MPRRSPGRENGSHYRAMRKPIREDKAMRKHNRLTAQGVHIANTTPTFPRKPPAPVGLIAILLALFAILMSGIVIVDNI